MVDFKWCTSCSVRLRASEFNRDKSRLDGLNPRCRRCANAQQRAYYAINRDVAKEKMSRRRYVKEYGITKDEKQAMIDSQHGQCQVCDESLTIRSPLDHDHETGKVRDVLCADCNLGLGRFKDDPNLLDYAASYLRRHGR